MRIGYIGLGKMGKPMALNLRKAGFSVTVYDVAPAPVEELVRAGAAKAGSPAEVGRASDVVFTSLPTVEASEAVFLGVGGLASVAKPGQVLADMSTVGLATSKKIAAGVSPTGASFLDSPVSGGPERAIDGTLTIFVGGDAAAFQKAKPALEAMGKVVRHVGATGAGCVFKLVNQLLVAINVIGVAEAISLSNKAGVNPRLIIEMISTAWGGSTQLTRTGPLMVARDFSPKGTNILLYKDMGFVRQLASDLGVSITLGEQAWKVFEEAMADGMAEKDIASVLLLVEKHSKKK
ncbi:MAG: NAD(P)-binding domain-containing protein [Chloroflexota bacterium]|nr:NAD(P)-binding domain-containing protein [Chloroflexota bacterium]